MKARAAALVALVAGALCAGAPTEAAADPSVWARARNPEVNREAEVLAEADALYLKWIQLRRPRAQTLFRDPGLGKEYLREAREKLEAAGAARSRNVAVRTRLAEILYELDEHAQALKHYEWIVGSSASAPVRAEAWSDLAVCYTRLDRHDEEIQAYGQALALQAHSRKRATIFANRAEAYMLKGDLTSAIEGYRGSLALLTQNEMQVIGVTTLWGLAVALDRSGDLEKAIETLHIARSYDERDSRINDKDAWFFVPAYDEAWYGALGHWARARKADLGAARAEHYGRAVMAWEDFVARAAPTDPWLPIAKVRLRQCEKERDDALRRARMAPKKPPVAGSPAGPTEVLEFDSAPKPPKKKRKAPTP